jgi:hypothetical protein
VHMEDPDILHRLAVLLSRGEPAQA